ncbi:MAG: EAL domain-containing protein, partial [Aquamicrobium sp.]|nr:EAL domain-containing protein [Aquamicrobium sp.]
VGLHFTGMTAFRVEPMLVDGSFSDPAALQALAFAIAGVAVVVFVPGFATRLIDDHSRAESAQALRNMSNGLVMVSGRGTIRLYNDRVLSLFGLAPDELRVGMPMSRFLRNIGARVGWDEARTQRVIDNHGQWMARDATTRVEHHFEDGRILSISCRPTGGGGAIITYDDVTEAREGQKKIAHLAYHDALTGLPNRRSFTDRVVRLSRQSSFAMLMLDLDRFKAVNDTLGHPVGDELLVQVVARLRGVCGDADLAFRLGGDEFGLLTTRQQDKAHALADGIVRALAAPFQIGEHLVSIGASVGMATSPCGGDTDLVQRMADLALYKAKENGRGRVEVYREGMIEEAAARRRLEADLVGAVEAGQLELHYQPLFDLPGRALSGFEALLRWHHPERGTVPPGEFIPIAEQCGAIVDIGAWVIDEACRQAALWPAHIYVSVNVSPVQLRSPDILRQLTRSLDRHGLTPRRIEVEVTETAMIENSEAIATVLAGLRALGVRIAMDDFGTGYSSLAHLRAFKLDRIKIDRSFVSGSHADAGSAAVVRAVTAMARDLAIATTGEGVESEEQLANLIELGCGAAQGFLLGRPLDAAGATGLAAGRPGAAKRLTS